MGCLFLTQLYPYISVRVGAAAIGCLVLAGCGSGDDRPTVAISLAPIEFLVDARVDEVWEITRAMDTWEDATGIELFGEPTVGEVEGGHNFLSEIYFAPLADGQLGVCNRYYDSQGVYETDIIFNSNYALSARGGTEVRHLYSVALHELGHAVGLEHSSGGAMAANIRRGVELVLTRRNINEVLANYGE